jgi:hypothetical protein
MVRGTLEIGHVCTESWTLFGTTGPSLSLRHFNSSTELWRGRQEIIEVNVVQRVDGRKTDQFTEPCERSGRKFFDSWMDPWRGEEVKGSFELQAISNASSTVSHRVFCSVRIIHRP